MPTGDVARLTVSGTVQGQTHLHTLHFRYLTATASEAGLINSWQAGALSAYRALFSVSDSPALLLKAEEVCGDLPLRAPAEEAQSGTPSQGSRAAATVQMPPWVAAVTSVKTNFSGRQYRGRYYLGGIQESDQELGVLNSTYMTLLQQYATVLETLYGTAGSDLDYRHVVWSQTRYDLGGFTCVAATADAETLVPRSALGTMKSRKAGSGS